MLKKQIRYFENLQLTHVSDKIVAVEIEEISDYNLEIKFLHFGQNRKVVEENDLYLSFKDFDSFYFSVEFIPKPESKQRFLKIQYDSKYNKRFTYIDISNSGITQIIDIIYLLLNFCKNNANDVREFGFRESLSSEIVFLKYKKKEFLISILKLKIYSLETSEIRVGKDNIFRDYRIIKYLKSHNVYFLKLLKDSLSNYKHDKEKLSFTIQVSEDKAWSPSFDDRIIELSDENTRIDLIAYFYDHFSLEEIHKFNLLNIEV